ncbi:MAG TPA: DUF2071 domain-containing protein [Capsulimonadaceae bacterium]|nr:DUF2071 domain-containing protein [Capsulimonadaceae bacterium]
MIRLPKNPLTMVGTLDRCWLFTFQTPEEDAWGHLPDPLVPVTHNGYAFWNVVVSHIQSMRPKGAPAALGLSYWHVGYRLYARCETGDGTAIEGLYFARSDCDKKLMTFAGNILTDYHFHTAPISARRDGEGLQIDIASPDAPANATLCLSGRATLPPYSAFASLEEAAAFLKYKPFGLSVLPGGEVSVVKIVRDETAWRGRLVQVQSERWAFLADKSVRPEICYEVSPIAYQWNRAKMAERLATQLKRS